MNNESFQLDFDGLAQKEQSQIDIDHEEFGPITPYEKKVSIHSYSKQKSTIFKKLKNEGEKSTELKFNVA